MNNRSVTCGVVGEMLSWCCQRWCCSTLCGKNFEHKLVQVPACWYIRRNFAKNNSNNFIAVMIVFDIIESISTISNFKIGGSRNAKPFATGSASGCHPMVGFTFSLTGMSIKYKHSIVQHESIKLPSDCTEASHFGPF